MSVLRDLESHASIIVGRTGQGKTALLIRLEQVESNTIRLNLFELAFRYVENSTVLRFFEDSGVNLDLFYRLLWRHVLVTELIKKRYSLRDRSGFERWLDGLHLRFRPGTPKAKALEYMLQWGDSFWEETEVRLKEVTSKLENELESSVEGTAFKAKLRLGGKAALTEEERREVSSRGSAVVSRVQIKELSQIVDLLDEHFFDDRQKPYFVLIDSLDEEWVSSAARLKLIRSLLEEIRSFRRVRHVKVVCALRQDLIEQVFEATRDGGFQEEKYEAYYAHIVWTRSELISLVEARVSEVFKRRYTNRIVRLADIFPSARSGREPLDHIIERTFNRPRDVISYVNECFRLAADRPRISWKVIQDAETPYSKKRLKALLDEWLVQYPSLPATIDCLKGFPESFTRAAFNKGLVDGLATQLCTMHAQDPLIRAFKQAYTDHKSSISDGDLVCAILQLLFHVGVVGLKTGEESAWLWASRDQASVTWGDVKRSSHIRVHKMFWKALEIRVQVWNSAGQP